MNKYDLKIEMVLNGEYKLGNGNAIIKDIDQNDVKNFVNTKIKPEKIMNRCAKKVYNMNLEYNGNICGDCENFVFCPKVRDSEKRSLKAYPYITDGIEIILIDKEMHDSYLEACKTYNELKDNEDFSIEDDLEFRSTLNLTGREVSHILVTGCKKFVDDSKKVKEKVTDVKAYFKEHK